jgi:hypothetical protein
MICTLKNILAITIIAIAAIAFADQGPRFTPGTAGSSSVINTEAPSVSEAARASTDRYGPHFTPGIASSTIDVESVSVPVSFPVFAHIGTNVEMDWSSGDAQVPSGRFGPTLTRLPP